jgi:pSer/pThr/pTyr-binding forkhead associated (FHA) protein
VSSDILLIEEIGSAEPTEVARLDRSCPVAFGREAAPGTVALPFPAVSRAHGRILPLGSYWFYQDLGSTNGSWLNGNVVPAQTMRLIRSGDMLQLADAILKVTEISHTGIVINGPQKDLPARSLIVVEQDIFIAEYPVPDYGRALVVGGPGANLEISGAMLNVASLIVERKGMYTAASGSANQMPALLDGQPIMEAVPLQDGQQITVGNYTIIYNEPGNPENSLSVISGSGWSTTKSNTKFKREDNRSDDSGGSFLNKPAQGSLFGKPLEVQEAGMSVSETVRIDPALLEKRLGRDYHPSMRTSVEPSKKGFAFEVLEERLVLVIGFFLLLALLALLVLWLFI